MVPLSYVHQAVSIQTVTVLSESGDWVATAFEMAAERVRALLAVKFRWTDSVHSPTRSVHTVLAVTLHAVVT